jgi:predicted Zn-dependent protease
MKSRILVDAVLLSLLLAAGCSSRQPGQPVTPGFNVYSKEQDIQLGRQAAQQVLRQVDVVDNQALQQYVDRIGGRLAQQPQAENYPYEFTLINDPSINAFALPGGPIFVNSGLIQAAENEAQVAGVLAHEIAHVALRHATNQASKASLLQIPAAIAGGVMGQGSVLGQLGQVGLGFGLNALLLKYSRSAEEQADALGAQLMANAGYNPIEMARFFEKLEGEGASRAPEFLSSHPSPGNRIEDVQREVQALPQRNYAENLTGDFAQAKQLVARLPKPRVPEQQAVASAGYTPPVPANFQTLNTARFQVAYPAGWQVYGSNNSPMVTLAPEQALVRNQYGGVDVGYGLIISYYQPERATSVAGATQELVGHIVASNPTMSVAGQARAVQAGGVNGQVITLRSRSPYGGSEVDVLLTAPRPEGLFYMVFIAPEQHWGQLEGAFDQILRSIRFRG